MTQSFDTPEQIRYSESVGTIQGIYRHLQWQLRQMFPGLLARLGTVYESTTIVAMKNATACVNSAFVQENPKTFDESRNKLPAEKYPAKVVLLTNCIPPYVLPVLQHLADSLESFRVLLSTPMESDRPWQPKWDGVEVIIQRTITFKHNRIYNEDINASTFTHFPLDVLPLLFCLGPDVVISAQLGFRTLQSVIYRCPHRNSRLVIWADLSEHSEKRIGRILTGVRRFLLRYADAVLVNGASGSSYIRRLGVPKERIVEAPYTTNIDPFLAVPLTRDGPNARRLLYVGRLVEIKGLELFLPVLFDWATKHTEEYCEFWLVGDGPLRHGLEQLEAPANVKLKFFGDVPYARLAEYYAHAGILVLPSLSETWGLVVSEAMAAGLVVLGSRYSAAVNELVRDDMNGWTFCPDRPDDLRRALERAMSTPLPSLDEMREAARKSVSRITPEYVAGRFLQAICVAMNQ